MYTFWHTYSEHPLKTEPWKGEIKRYNVSHIFFHPTKASTVDMPEHLNDTIWFSDEWDLEKDTFSSSFKCQWRDLRTFTCLSFQISLRGPDMITAALSGSEHMRCVFCATNWIIDLPHSLFLDLNDIPGNFSNCHDLICTPSPACWVVNVKGERRGLKVASHLKRGTTLRSTFIQARRNSHNSFFFFSFIFPPPLSETLSTNLSSSRST